MGYSIKNHTENMLSTLKKIDIRHVNYGLMKKGFKLSTKLTDLKHSQLTGVYVEALDNEAEEYGATMREGHGVGCYCNYCCM